MEEERRLCYVGMTRARKRLILTWARYRRRFGGGEAERSAPSGFLSEVPEQLIVNLGPHDESGEINLHGERHDVRQSAQRNTYTGKTYNSLDNISQFFGERGMPFNRPGAPPARPALPPGRLPVSQFPRPQGPPRPLSGAPPARPSGPSGLPPSAASQLPRPQGPTRQLPTAPPAPRKTARTGMTVNHPKYGTGTVVRREGEGDDAKITVNFPRFGLKKLIEKYAGLKRD